MATKNISLFSIVFLFTMLFIYVTEVKAQYLPVGPQTNVPVDTVINGGWTQCYIDTYDNSLDTDAENVLSQCPGERLMLACRMTGSDTLILLAQGERSDVIFDTGINENVLHIANGVGWYFADNFSWGFVRAGDIVDKDECDVDDTPANDERLCWHLTGGGGYRCGATENLNESTEYERIVYMATPQPAQVPTLSEWGLITVAGLLGIVGFMVIRRRQLTA